MNTENLDNHIEVITAEIKKNAAQLVDQEHLPTETILRLFEKQNKLGQVWQWLQQSKAALTKPPLIQPVNQNLIN